MSNQPITCSFCSEPADPNEPLSVPACSKHADLQAINSYIEGQGKIPDLTSVIAVFNGFEKGLWTIKKAEIEKMWKQMKETA